MGFSPDTRGRAFTATVQIKNMELMGLSEEQYKDPEYLANFLTTLWNNSGKGRTSAVAVCISHNGLYHAHMAVYGNTTTLKKVADILFQSHVEPQLGGKAQLQNYLLKQGEYAEKGEQILFVKDIEQIQDVKGKRSDLEVIEEMLARGMTPQKILDTNFSFYRYEKMILHAYIDQRIRDAPLRHDVYVEWHTGPTGSGKTFIYNRICDNFGAENIYIMSDYDNGGYSGLDSYMKEGAPPILFMDEFKGHNFPYSKLLLMLNGYTRMQTHSRYANTYNLWEKIYITSIYPPEEAYEQMVKEENRKIDSLGQLIRRINKIVYHYKWEGQYLTYSVDGKDYTDYEQLETQALAQHNPEGFTSLTKAQQLTLPFQYGNN